MPVFASKAPAAIESAAFCTRRRVSVNSSAERLVVTATFPSKL
jgi:hypothetical protein